MELTNISRFAKLLPSEGEAGRQVFEGDLARLQDKLRTARNGTDGAGVRAKQLRAAAQASAQADSAANGFRERHAAALQDIGNGPLHQEDRAADFPLPAAAGGQDATSKGLREVIMHGIYGPTEFDRAQQISRMQESFNQAARDDMRDLVDRCNEARNAWQEYKIEGELATKRLGDMELRESAISERIQESERRLSSGGLDQDAMEAHMRNHSDLLEARERVQAERQQFIESEMVRLGESKAQYQDLMLDAQKETDAFLDKHGWRYELTDAERREITEFEVNAPGGMDLADDKKWGADVRKGFYSELNQQMEMERLRDTSQKKEVETSVAHTKESSQGKEMAPAEQRASEQEQAAGKQLTPSEGREVERGEQRDSSRGMVYSDGHLMRGPGEGKVFQDGQVLTEMSEDEKMAYKEQMGRAAGVKEIDGKSIEIPMDRKEKSLSQEEPGHETKSRAAAAQERLGPVKDQGHGVQQEHSRAASAQQRLGHVEQKDMSPGQAQAHTASRAEVAQQRMNARDERPEQGMQQSTEVRPQSPVEAPQKAPQAQTSAAQAPQQAPAPQPAVAPAPAPAPAPQRSQAMSR